MEPESRIVVVRAPAQTPTAQGLPYFVGISGATAGARGLSLSLVAVPPGAISEPHFHPSYETAIYCLAGQVETRFGPDLEESVTCGPGDFVFIPPDLPHQARNASATEPALAVVARNDPAEEESAVLYDPSSSTVSSTTERKRGKSKGGSSTPSGK